MRKNYCIGGDLDGKTIECDENYHVHRCNEATPTQDYVSNSIDTPLMIESECQIYHYDIIATGKGRDSIHLMVYNIEQTDIMQHLIDGYCEGKAK